MIESGKNVLSADPSQTDRMISLHSNRCSIEDPFETWYDVAHVVKGPQMSYIRKEFLVSLADLIVLRCIGVI
jgi:hypothetical protein